MNSALKTVLHASKFATLDSVWNQLSTMFFPSCIPFMSAHDSHGRNGDCTHHMIKIEWDRICCSCCLPLFKMGGDKAFSRQNCFVGRSVPVSAELSTLTPQYQSNGYKCVNSQYFTKSLTWRNVLHKCTCRHTANAIGKIKLQMSYKSFEGYVPRQYNETSLHFFKKMTMKF